MNRWRAGALALGLSLAAVAAGPAAQSARAAVPAASLLPDLAMLAPTEFRLETGPGGERLLRFTTMIVNIGRGVLQMYGYDETDGMADIGDTLAVRQQIRQPDGSFVERQTTAKMTWSGDGHDHWHVMDYQRFWLQSLASKTVGAGYKTGFCSFDSRVYTSTKPAYYTWGRYACRTNPTSGRVLMGITRFWGDVYKSDIAFQWIDISGLPNGDYLLRVVADPELSTGGRFLESNETNNRAWAKIRIRATGVSVLSHSTNP